MMPIDGTLVVMLFSALAGFSFGIRVERERCAKRILETNWVDADPEEIAAAFRRGK